MKSRDREMFKVGPIGSILDNRKSLEWDEKGRNMISSIYFAFDSDGINCIQFSYPDQNGGGHLVSERYGASADTMKKKYKAQSHEIVRLKEDEFVTGLSAIHCMKLITSLNIHTNQGKHGPICNKFKSGNLDQYKNEIDVKIRDRREFGGFFGSFDDCGNLTSIGIYVCPITRISDAPLRTNYKVTDGQPTLYQSSDRLRASTTLEYQMPHHEVSDRELFKVGPIGSIHDNHKSLEWDEKGRNMISSIYFAFDSYGINCIQFSYPDQNGVDHVVSERYGASADTMKKKIKAQSHEIVRLKDDEFVTGLSAIHCMKLITSLNIHTNQGKHGPICNKFKSGNLDQYKREIDVKIRDRREFGGFFGSFDDCGNLTSIGIYVCPITRISDAPLRTNYKVTEVTDDDVDDQPILYQSYDHPLATVNHNETREYPMPHDHEVSDGYHVKAIAHKPKFEEKMSRYQSSDRLARSTNNRTLEYQMPDHEFADGYHVELEDGIFSKIERLFGNLLD